MNNAHEKQDNLWLGQPVLASRSLRGAPGGDQRAESLQPPSPSLSPPTHGKIAHFRVLDWGVHRFGTTSRDHVDQPRNPSVPGARSGSPLCEHWHGGGARCTRRQQRPCPKRVHEALPVKYARPSNYCSRHCRAPLQLTSDPSRRVSRHLAQHPRVKLSSPTAPRTGACALCARQIHC